MKNESAFAKKQVIIFDLDGTLTKSKSDLDEEMARLIAELLEQRSVAVTSGCSFHQFEDQFLDNLPKTANRSNLFLFPTCSASGYYFDEKTGKYYRAYSNLMPTKAVKRVLRAFEATFAEIGYTHPKRTYGPIFENRGSQLTFSALGQEAPLLLKRKWDPNQKKRLTIRRHLRPKLPNFEISIGGTTSIDVTRKGINKTLCVRKLIERLHVNKKEMLFVGDALFKGGNDYIMKSAGIQCVPVSGPKETKKLVTRIIQSGSPQFRL
jgi:phosphomannomutase